MHAAKHVPQKAVDCPAAGTLGLACGYMLLDVVAWTRRAGATVRLAGGRRALWAAKRNLANAVHALQTLSATGSAAINTPYQLAVANPAYTAVAGAWNWVPSGVSGGSAKGSVTQVPTDWASWSLHALMQCFPCAGSRTLPLCQICQGVRRPGAHSPSFLEPACSAIHAAVLPCAGSQAHLLCQICQGLRRPGAHKVNDQNLCSSSEMPVQPALHLCQPVSATAVPARATNNTTRGPHSDGV